jgi:allantoinase
MLKAAKAQNSKVTVETCPHYLTLESEQIPDGATEFKCAPPIREHSNRNHLWTAIYDGVIDFIATDHSPCLPAMKLKTQGINDEGNFLRAWGGIASLQLSLPAVWTEARSRGYAVSRVAEWLCAAPARLAGLDHRKGRIAPGCDADLVIWNPDARFTVDPMKLEHRHKITPYTGRALLGVVEVTFLRGIKIFERGENAEARFGDASGRVLKRGAC